MNLRTPIAAVTLALLSALASAQAPAASTPATPRVDARQAQQEKRIEQGQASGQLTKNEARRLKREQRHIAKAERHAKADGVVTPAERKRLDAMQDQASRDISRQKHDAQTTANTPARK
jgi:hypothetical protein